MDPRAERAEVEITHWTLERRKMAEWLYDRLMEDLGKKMAREEVVDRIEGLIQDATMRERSEGIIRARLHGHEDDAEALEALGSACVARRHLSRCDACRRLYEARLDYLASGG